MKRTKSAYMNYVCGLCFHKLHECTCEHFPPWQLIFIDEGIQDPVRVLNEKGYVTSGCCEGHYGQLGTNTSICLNMRYAEIADRDMPEGFKYMKSKNTLIHDYRSNMSKEEFAEEKQRVIAALLAWCNELPKEQAFVRAEAMRRENDRRRAEEMERLTKEPEERRARRR